MKKRLIPCIYLKNGCAVKSMTDHTVICEDPAYLVKLYADDQADEVIVFDFSETDEEHEAALDVLRKICAVGEIPVIGAGNVKRAEDIKKLLYAGCAKACLNYSKQTNIDLTKEVSERFGKDKIVAVCADREEIDVNRQLIVDFASEALFINAQISAAEIGGIHVPVIVSLHNCSSQEAEEYLAAPNVTGLSGAFVTENEKEIPAFKHSCFSNGIDVLTYESCTPWEDFQKNGDGMIPVIAQDYKTGEVLMLAYMNKEAYETTLRTGKMTYYSRSRKELWVKGETSGHFQYLKALTADCDMDTLLAKVSQVGAACHTGRYSCFFNEIMKKEYDDENPLTVFESVFDVIKDRKIHPKEGSYTNYLFDKGIDKILKKVGEEATEIVIAAKNPNPSEIKYEIADFLYHVMVLMAERGVTWEEITRELANR